MRTALGAGSPSPSLLSFLEFFLSISPSPLPPAPLPPPLPSFSLLWTHTRESPGGTMFFHSLIAKIYSINEVFFPGTCPFVLATCKRLRTVRPRLLRTKGSKRFRRNEEAGRAVGPAWPRPLLLTRKQILPNNQKLGQSIDSA